ncbi:unnamed protein product [Plutella xylostella]|uniref:(diamondback moth) hypothetical protein n=1 Tax=Plutella xylostella TaxID=51655 RepID=A0A8S4EY17_PLUXY|nr:unnamed protein product [Plutella xylostella]
MLAIERLQSAKQTDFKSFRIRIPAAQQKVLLDKNFWPAGIIFRRYREAKKTIKPPDNSAGVYKNECSVLPTGVVASGRRATEDDTCRCRCDTPLTSSKIRREPKEANAPKGQRKPRDGKSQRKERDARREEPDKKYPSQMRKAEGPIPCEQCGMQLEDSRAYHGHFRRAHPDKNRTNYPSMKSPCMCEVCGRMFQVCVPCSV